MKTKISLSLTFTVVITLIIISCKKNDLVGTQNDNYSSSPELPANPYDYKASPNDHLASLGRVLFYDKNLSLNNSVACASCHQQDKAFCDNLQFSVGLENVKTARNSPTIFAKSSRVFWDGRASSIRDLALKPIKNHVEMKFENLEALAKKISTISYYPALFKKAFPSQDNIDSLMIQSALAEFLKNFNFSNNKFTRSLRGIESLNASEKLGKLVFFNNGLCSNCHHIEPNNVQFPNDTINLGGGYGFTDESHNTGLNEIDTDLGVGAITHNSFENGAFMVPALLNVEFTAPYMHDGRFKTLEEVVEHYNSGIKNNPNLDPILRGFDENMTDEQLLALFDTNYDGEIEFSELSQLQPVKLNLTTAEKRGLVDFLKTLSDPSILSEPKFSNPFLLK